MSPRPALASAALGPTDVDTGRRLVALLRGTHPGRGRAVLSHHGAWESAHRRAGATGLPLPDWFEREGAQRRSDTLGRHLRAVHDLVRLGEVLDAAGVPWLTFKGPVVASLWYAPDERPYADLDVLVPPAAFADAVTALSLDGWPVRDLAVDLLARPPVGELHLVGPARTPLDLHWHPFYRADHVGRGRVNPEAVVARRVQARVGGQYMPTMAGPEHLVYVCAHAAAAGADRLRWLVDVARLIDHDRPDWGLVVATARAWGVPRGTGAVLARAARHVDAVVPGSVVRELLGDGPSRVAVGLLQRWDPVPSVSRANGPSARWARRADSGWVGAAARSLGRLGASSRRDARPPLRRPDVAATPYGTAALGAFLREVTHEAGRKRGAWRSAGQGSERRGALRGGAPSPRP